MRFISWVNDVIFKRRFDRDIVLAVVGLIAASLIAFLISLQGKGDLSRLAADLQRGWESESNKQTGEIISEINSMDAPISNCRDLEKWSNNDSTLNINEKSNTISLKHGLESGLLYFQGFILKSFVTKVDLELGDGKHPNVVLLFKDYSSQRDSFKLIIGNDDATVVTMQYWEDEWKDVEERVEKKHLSQPIASNESLDIRIETSPDNGQRTVKLQLIYKPAINPNADRQTEYFIYTFPVYKHPEKFNFTLGLINPRLLEDNFSFKIENCQIQEIKL